MLKADSPLTELCKALDSGATSVMDVARNCLDRANGSASQNTYIRLSAEELMRDAAVLQKRFSSPGSRPVLLGIPVSLKDCFDLAGTVTTCGSQFYARNAPAASDSAMATALRGTGCLITGKTHLHPLAYGITGQNPDYGDCLQPRDASLLTGGSSSGAAASVQEGSAIAAIGTDTGGSIRVPAALCGLAGYRASHAIASRQGFCPGIWSGASHLAPSFDTPGLLAQDPRDLAPIAEAVFDIPSTNERVLRVGCVSEGFLHDAQPEVLEALREWKQRISRVGCIVEEFSPAEWNDTYEIFAAIQASEAGALHRGHFHEFEESICARLEWGASLTTEQLEQFHARRSLFCDGIATLLLRFDVLMLPCAPISRLPAGTDLSSTRQVILRYTTPFSLAGLPALSLPGELLGASLGTGVQIAAAPLRDSMVLKFSSTLGASLTGD